MGIQGLGEIGAAAAFLDAVSDDIGTERISDVAKAEAIEAEGRIAAAIGPAVAAAAGWYLAKKLPAVPLDVDEPFSDASLSNALSAVLGVQVASIKNREVLKDAFRRAITARVSFEVGSPFENVFDRTLLRRDVLRALGARSSRVVPGLEIHDLSNRQQTTADVFDFARLKVSDLLGINFTNLRSRQAVKEDIYAWAMPIVQQQVTDNDTPSQYYKKPLKMDRKSVRNREAQRRFRAKWGNVKKYWGIDE